MNAAADFGQVEGRITNRAFGLFLAALIVLAFPWAVIGLKLPLFRDFGLYSYPNAHFLRESLRHGEWPLWNPLSFCGIPFLAQWNTLALYPLALIYIVLPLAQGLTWFSLLHVWIGGFGMFRLAQRWTGSSMAAALAGVVYALNGVMLDTGIWPCSIGPLAWAPWFIATAREYWNGGGRALLPALAASVMLMLAPLPEIIFMAWMFAGAVWVADEWRERHDRSRRLGRFLLLAVLTAGICAVQIIPFIELVGLSHRAQDPTRMLWPMPPTGWANLLIPLYLCVPAHHGIYFQPNQSFVSSYYMGIGTILLALVAIAWKRDRRAVVAVTLAVFSLIMALGDATPFFGLFNRAFPPLRLMRFSVKYVFLLALTLPVAVAFAAARLESARAAARDYRHVMAALATVAAGLLGGMLVLLLYARSFPMAGHDLRVTAVSALSRASFLLLILGALLQWMRARDAKRVALWGWAVIALWAGDLLTHKPVRTPWVDPWVLKPGILWEHWGFTSRPAHGGSRVMFRPADENRFGQFVAGNPNEEYVGQRLACSFNCNLFDGIPKVAGFYPLKPKLIYEVQQLFNSSPEELVGPLADFLSVAYVNVRGKFYEWEARPSALPMLTFPARVKWAGRGDTLKGLLSPDFDPRETVFLPEEAKGQVNETWSRNARVLDAQFAAREVHAAVETEKDALLVWNQTAYPHWRAYVDGRPVTIWRANHAFQAVVVPPGRHDVVWRYEDRTLRRSLVISVLSLTLSAVLVARSRHRGSVTKAGRRDWQREHV